MRQKNTLTGIEGVIAGGVATANAPVGRRIHALKIFYTESGSPADVLAGIEYVRCIVNGVHIIDLTPEQILAIPKLNGITPVTGELPLYFSEPWRASGDRQAVCNLFSF